MPPAAQPQAATPEAVSEMSATALDVRAFRSALGRFPTGVTVVTARDQRGALIGLTVNSFNSLSLDPPLILWSLRKSSPSLAALMAAPHFAVNVLAEGQAEVSRCFASPIADKFAEVPHAVNGHGVPLLHGAAAWFECRAVSHQEAGDHVLFIGEVLRFDSTEQASLVYHAGAYHLVGERL